MYDFYGGVDLGGSFHVLHLTDAQGHPIAQHTFGHSGQGIAGMIDHLRQFIGEGMSAAFAVEQPRTAVGETLMAAGFDVFHINPRQTERLRDVQTMSGRKSDRFDSAILANALRTSPAIFSRIWSDVPVLSRLRELSREDDELKDERVRLCNKMRSLIETYFPALLQLCPACDREYFWALFEAAPTPERARQLTVESLLVVKSQFRLSHDPETVLRVLQEEPLVTAEGIPETHATHILRIIARVRSVDEQRKRCRKEMEACLKEVDQRYDNLASIIASMPGVGVKVLSILLGEAGYEFMTCDYRAIRSLSGCAPVTRQSGKSSLTVMRRSCNPRLRYAMFHMARSAKRTDERWKAMYGESRKRGCTSARALRQLADRMLKPMMAMIRTRELYHGQPVVSAMAEALVD